MQQRFLALPAPGIEEELVLRPGSLRDYALLSSHHYKSARPATVTRVLVLEHKQPTVCGRFLGRCGEACVVGVLVESLPSLSCRLRDWALHDRYAGLRDLSQRATLLNREVRCVSRVVVHPQWRGLGVAVRLVKAALASATTVFTEALAAMGHVNPFFERAGMAAHHRPPHASDARLIGALALVGLSGVDLALPRAAWARVEGLPCGKREWVVVELERWWGRTHRERRTLSRERRGEEGMELLREARGRLLCEPVYYLRDNREGVS
ncbi:MAG: GNAT family N-acetyltransferase [Planctomycetes bacterium]|nr:GNAT family N-acetyltransferase [Planctomycetota bacterium]